LQRRNESAFAQSALSALGTFTSSGISTTKGLIPPSELFERKKIGKINNLNVFDKKKPVLTATENVLRSTENNYKGANSEFFIR
jgi:hypothetical protein